MFYLFGDGADLGGIGCRAVEVSIWSAVVVTVGANTCGWGHLPTVGLFFDCGLDEPVLSSSCKFVDLVRDADEMLVWACASIEKGFEADGFLRSVTLYVFLLLVNVLKLMDKLRGGSFTKSFLLFLSLNN